MHLTSQLPLRMLPEGNVAPAAKPPGMAVRILQGLVACAIHSLAWVLRRKVARAVSTAGAESPACRKSQVERAPFVLIRRGANGNCDTCEARADQTSIAGSVGGVGRLRGGLVESRPAGAHAGGVCATAEGFKTILRATSSEALPEHDFASKVLLEGLPPGQDIFYRVRFEDIAERECRERPASACEVSSGAAYFNHGMGIRPNLTKRNNEVRFFSMSHCVCYL
jgi:PhoD-like phosphatase, N-terminal domain